MHYNNYFIKRVYGGQAVLGAATGGIGGAVVGGIAGTMHGKQGCDRAYAVCLAERGYEVE